MDQAAGVNRGVPAGGLGPGGTVRLAMRPGPGSVLVGTVTAPRGHRITGRSG
ncbi:hypothetical protein [Streptomyces sp. RFCAC02]|uniref:hypothetical protein n=1 Tax=Streptomyces sp. RFCAC02 TaxID=2499143 RepID=UPI00143E05AA|nr:hypothetical protein [Streptomyces sp. RFCAC02]